MSGYNPIAELFDRLDESLSEEEREEQFYELWDEAQDKFDPVDWINGRIDRSSLDRDDLYTLREWFVEKIIDSGFQYPPELIERLQAWPQPCTLSEERLRSAVRDLLADVKALRRKAQALQLQADERWESEADEWIPPSVFAALASAVSILLDNNELESTERYLEQALSDTPETLARRWLKEQSRYFSDTVD